MRSIFVIDITLADGGLYARGSRQGRFQVFPESETRFFARDVNVQLEFARDDAGVVSGLMLYQNGRTAPAPRRPMAGVPLATGDSLPGEQTSISSAALGGERPLRIIVPSGYELSISSLHPGSARTWNHLGDLLRALCRAEESRTSYAKAYELASQMKYDNVSNYAGELNRSKNEIEKGRPCSSPAEERAPRSKSTQRSCSRMRAPTSFRRASPWCLFRERTTLDPADRAGEVTDLCRVGEDLLLQDGAGAVHVRSRRNGRGYGCHHGAGWG